MEWDPVRTQRNALWITGGQWAGKSTVAGILAGRYGLTHYAYDFHTTRGHDDRRLAAQIRRGEAPAGFDAEATFLRSTPAEAAEQALATFPERFEWALDDLRGMITPLPVIADGWGLRPELIAPVTSDLGRVLVMVPTDQWRAAQAATVPRASAVGHRVSDPALAQRNRIARDRLIAADAVEQARALGIRVLEVDGSHGAQGVADQVADHFAAFLPAPLALRAAR